MNRPDATRAKNASPGPRSNAECQVLAHSVILPSPHQVHASRLRRLPDHAMMPRHDRDSGGGHGIMGMTGTTGPAEPTGTGPDVSLTTAAAAQLAGVSPRTIRRWIEKGTLPATTGAGGVFYVFAQDLEAAQRASLTRTSGPSSLTARFSVAEDNNTVPDVRDRSGTSQLTPDPAGGAAGAILVAWRDTVLSPVVEELSATRRELGQVHQELGRLKAERDQAERERDALRAELTAARGSAQETPLDIASAGDVEIPTPSADLLALGWRRWWRRVTGG